MLQTAGKRTPGQHGARRVLLQLELLVGASLQRLLTSWLAPPAAASGAGRVAVAAGGAARKAGEAGAEPAAAVVLVAAVDRRRGGGGWGGDTSEAKRWEFAVLVPLLKCVVLVQHLRAIPVSPSLYHNNYYKAIVFVWLAPAIPVVVSHVTRSQLHNDCLCALKFCVNLFATPTTTILHWVLAGVCGCFWQAADRQCSIQCLQRW